TDPRTRANANGRPQGRPFHFRVALSGGCYFFSSSPGLGGGLLGCGPCGGGCPGPRTPCGGGGGGCAPGCGGGCTRCCGGGGPGGGCTCRCCGGGGAGGG